MILVGTGGLCWILFALGHDLVGSLLGGGMAYTFACLLLGAADLYMAARFYRGYKRHQGITLPLALMVLVVIVGVSWFLLAFGYNPVTRIFGAGAPATFVYLILGLASIYWIVILSTQGHG